MLHKKSFANFLYSIIPSLRSRLPTNVLASPNASLGNNAESTFDDKWLPQIFSSWVTATISILIMWRKKQVKQTGREMY